MKSPVPLHVLCIASLALVAAVSAARGAEAPAGVRVFMIGHSFAMKTVPLLTDVAEVAGVKGHTLAGTMLLGGSRAITLWEKPDAENPAKAALRDGKADDRCKNSLTSASP